MHWTERFLGAPTVTHGAVVVDDYIYAFRGSYFGSFNSHRRKQMKIFVFDTKALLWDEIPPQTDRNGTLLTYPQVPNCRLEHTAVAYKKKIYLLGGISPNSNMQLYCFDPKTVTWSRPEVTGAIPKCRVNQSACVNGEFMYVFGGYVYGIRGLVRDVYALNLETFEWKNIRTFGSLPSARRFHTAVALKNRMYVFGGRTEHPNFHHTSDSLNCGLMFYLDLETYEWHHPTPTGRIPLLRSDHSMFIYNEKIYIFGGFNCFLNLYLNDLFSFDTEKNRWTKIRALGNPPTARDRHAAVVKDKRLFVFGGTTDPDWFPQFLKNDMHVLELSFPNRVIDYK